MVNYNTIHDNGSSPYGAGDPYYSQSTGYIAPVPQPKKGTSNWVKFGIPIAVIVIAGAVVGAILGIRASKSSDDSSSTSGASSSNPSDVVSVKAEVGRFATATNSEFMVPVYPSTTNAAAYTVPTFVDTSDSSLAWPSDPWQPANPSVTSLRSEHPRLIAPAYMWEALPTLIKNDPYLTGWNATIFGNASDYYSADPVAYVMDGDSGILDNAREVKMRIKAFCYVYRMTNDTKWADRAWMEVQNAAGNGTTTFGPDEDKWNNAHFLDTAEFAAAFAIAYDWLFDVLTDEQKSQIRYTVNLYALGPGVSTYTDSTNYYGWWQKNTTGNWNCVCNGGLTLASLAILDEDETGNAATLLGLTVDNALQNCVYAVSDDGTWKETANYWYFGTTGHAEMSASLITATGSALGMLDTNENFYKTGDFHMYNYGPTSKFDWGDHGPNKFSSTANSVLFYGAQYDQPTYTLFQREQADAAEPFGMFWYDPTVTGAYWNGKALDAFFDADLDQWTSMRSSWTDPDALFVAMKAGKNQGLQTHNDLDCGDFVLDALGTRWAGEYGSGDYRSTDYFSNDTQTSDRWLYFRKRTEGQSTLLINAANQDVAAAPKILNSGSSGTKQGSSTVLSVDKTDTAFWVADMTSAYFDATSVKRGVRLLNGRKQVLIQDEVDVSASLQWRMHTNATVTASGSTATLERDGKKLEMTILSPSGASTDPTPPDPDQENPGITIVIIELEAGTHSIEVLFNPQWDDVDFVTPSSVALDDWSLTSHN
ncbi:chondroitin AC/alginate lyase [Mucidula mucida]|nr:chondroitin AC/alginate lyase [Mucidula mucida]